MELSSALSVLFTTMKGYYQHPKAIISAFENVQYHGEISSPLGGTLSVLQKMLITLEEKMDDTPPIYWHYSWIFCSTYNISNYIIYNSIDGIVNLRLKSVQSALSDLLTTSATHGTISRPSTKRGLILICLELNTNAKESFEHCRSYSLNLSIDRHVCQFIS